MMKDLRHFQLERLLPTLRKNGYDGTPRYTYVNKNGNKVPFRVEVAYQVNDTSMFPGTRAELYHMDCYPVTGKREAVLHLWDWAGMAMKGECIKIARELTAAGIAARATTYQKSWVVAFDPGDWINFREED